MAKKNQAAEEIQGQANEAGIGAGEQAAAQGGESINTESQPAPPAAGVEVADEGAGDEVEQAHDAAVAPALVRMYRDIDFDSDVGGPEEADVHPDEVANYAAAGWVVAGE